MKRFRLVFLIVVLIILVAVLSNIFAINGAAGESQVGDDWLHVKGNKILDKNGTEVWITGANWFGFNCRERMLLDSYHSNIVADIEMVANKGINCVRLPIATDLLYAWSKGQYPASTDTSYNNSDLAGLNSYELFNFMLENFKRVGIKVILDVHSAETDNMGHTVPLWYTSSVTEEMFMSAWVWVANHYKNDDTIIGFDLKNEPHTNSGTLKIKAQSAIWDDSNSKTNWKRVAQETALKILNVHPNALIFVEGVEIYPEDHLWDEEQVDTSPWTGIPSNYFGNWWGGNLRGVEKYPIDLGKFQSQLVYSPHDYGPIVYEQEWFKGDYVSASDKEAKQILYDKCWRDNWAYIMEDGISPLLLGEWGGLTEGNNSLMALNLKYLRSMRDYISENKYKLHHTFWCINTDSADTGGLLTRDEGTAFPGSRDLKWNDNKYDNYLLPVLWKNSQGKFIGLDHQVPLGSNGISLGEYSGNSTDEPVISKTTVSQSKTPTQTPTTQVPTTQTTVQTTTTNVTTTPPGATTSTVNNTTSISATEPASNIVINYNVVNDWGSGATVNIIIKNNGAEINGWELTFTFPGTQKITNLWNGKYTQSGNAVTITNETYSANISANGSITIGFGIQYTGSNVAPNDFKLN